MPHVRFTLVALALSLCAPLPARAQAPQNPRRRGFTGNPVQVTEAIVRSLAVGPDVFHLVLVRCEDLVPRGGSDCWDRGLMNHLELRAFARPNPVARWQQRVALPWAPVPAMTAQGGRVTITQGRRSLSFAIADGRP